MALEHLERYPEAVERFREAVRLAPADAALRRAQLLFDNKIYAKVREQMQGERAI